MGGGCVLSNMERKVLVTGATGYVGGRLVSKLLAAGFDVRCLARDASRLEGRAWEGVEIVQGDLLEPDTLPAALQGVEAAYYLVHSMAAGEAKFAERDRIAARNFARAARDAGIARIIYLGGLGSDQSELSHHLRSRQEIGEILRDGQVPVTEFRAAIIVGSGSMSFEMIRYLAERIPVMVCPRWVKTLCQPISIHDVLAYLVAALEEPRSVGKIIEIGGGTVLSYKRMLLDYAAVRRLRRWLIEVPVLTPRLSSLWVNLVTPIPTDYARPLIEGLRSPVVVTNSLAQDLFPTTKPVSYKEAVEIALRNIDLNLVETNWASSLQSAHYANPPNSRLQVDQGMIIERREARVKASPEQVYRAFARIGGRNGWYYANWLWRLRALLDRLVGGVGMRRGRRNPNDVVQGDSLDWWRVEAVEKDRLMRLRAEMRLPGRGWLEFRVEPAAGNETRLQQIAYFQPKGLFGLLYWYVLYPVHRLIFKGLVRAVARSAEGHR
jgi:uncharacterized protein YbjT (DUF2867 family)/uncharacterized protein YndB with AHSA1/START domain